MEKSMGTGFMAVFAVSGSMVFLAVQVHKRLLSNFMKKMEFEIRRPPTGGKEAAIMMAKKKVRFADEEGGQLCGVEGNMKKGCTSKKINDYESLEGMPQNWQAMYKGILQCRNVHKSYY